MVSKAFGLPLSAVQVVACALVLSACADSGLDWFSKKSAPVAVAATDEPQPAPLVKPTAHSSIPVLVNDVPITEYDIGQRQRLDRLGSGGKPVARETVVNELIDETLEAIEAQRQNVTIPDQQVDGAFANIASHVKLTPPGLTKALGSQGIDATSLKRRLRAQMVWQTLVQRRTLGKAKVTNQAVKDALAAKGDTANSTMTEYTLQQIIFVVPKGSPAGLVAQRRSEAVAFRQRFAGCDGSIAQAKPLRDVVVKDLGRRSASELTGPDGEDVKKTKVGEATLPRQIDDGVALIAVCATRDIQSAAQIRNEVQNGLYIEQAADLGKDYLQELHERAIIERR